VFVATVNFSSHARQFCAQVSRRVVLVDGPKLADLMIRHNVGVRVRHSYQVKRVDMDYFTAAPAARAWTGAGLVNPSTGR
jgi:restriction system protein